MTTEQAVDTAKLDAELAEKLFGWTRIVAGQAGAAWRDADGRVRPNGQFSTTGDGELMVRNEMQRLGWFYHVQTCEDGTIEAGFWRHGDASFTHFAHGLSPTAVALAALSAL